LGQDTLTGGAGADTFVFLKSDTGEERITDFKVLDGDQLDLSQLLQGVVLDWSAPDSVGRYLKLLGSGDDALLKVAPTGSGNFDAAELTITLGKGWSTGGMGTDLMALHDQRVILA
jgi:Ca2+-binding RTX toxin-like protein